MAVDKETQINRMQKSYDTAIKKANREWAMAKNAPTEVAAGPHYHRAKLDYDRAKYCEGRLNDLKNS